MATYKLPKELKKRMERELRQYWGNVSKLERLKKNVDIELNENNLDFITQKDMNLLSTRSIIFLSERVLYVLRVIKRLSPFEREVFYWIFKENYDCVYCQTMKNISKNTYYNIYNKCIYYLAEEFGEI